MDLVSHLSGPDRCEMVVHILYGGAGVSARVRREYGRQSEKMLERAPEVRKMGRVKF